MIMGIRHSPELMYNRTGQQIYPQETFEADLKTTREFYYEGSYYKTNLYRLADGRGWVLDKSKY